MSELETKDEEAHRPEGAPEAHVDADELVPEDDTIIGVAFRWSLAVIAVVLVVVAVVLFSRREKEAEPEIVDRGPVAVPEKLNQAAPDRPDIRFTDVTRAAGIDFVHFNSARGEKLLPETMGAGAAFFDYDGDGDPDLLLSNGAPWPHHDAPAQRPTVRLYANDGTGRFQDVTKEAGLDVTLYGTGIAVGDQDGDGDPDVFLAALGSNRMFRNDGGHFVDVTDSAGVAGDPDAWSCSAGFFDADNDGDLDLFVTNYVQWSRQTDLDLDFTLNGTDRAYGPPKLYRGTDSYFYRNEGDGTFTDVTAESGVQVRNPATGEPMGKGLALTFLDVDKDGWMDVFVANDTVQNFLFHNKGHGQFEEIGALAGVAFDGVGAATGAMGCDAADYRNEGTIGLAIGNFANESTSFYVQQRGPMRFADISSAEGIGSPSRRALSFGLVFLDADLDGRLDMLQANGHLEDEINEIQPSQHYRQPPQLFWNTGDASRACFAAVPDDELGELGKPIVGRGVAMADIDADGDLDVLLTQAGGPPVLARNDSQTGHHWLRVRLEGRAPATEGIGSWITVKAGDVTQRRQVMPTRSYLSQVELPVTFGLGDSERVDSVKVTWPDGTEQDVAVDGVDRVITVRRAG